MNVKTLASTEETHFGNIDFIRALASLIVVASHYGLFPAPEATGTYALIYGSFNRLVVPMFMVASVFLFARKERSSEYVRAKASRMLLLAAFWSCIFYIANGGIPAYIGKLSEIAGSVAREPLRSAYYLASGLQTVFYFFVSLAIVQFLAFLLQRIGTLAVASALAACLLAIFLLPFLLDGELAVFDNPINFLAFAPAGVLLNRLSDKLIKWRLPMGVALLALGLATMALECFVMHPGDLPFITGGTKVSLVFLATGIFVVTLRVRRPNAVVRFMSDQSLALYILHTCVFSLVATIYVLVFEKGLRMDAAWSPGLQSILAVIICYAIGGRMLPRVLVTKWYST